MPGEPTSDGPLRARFEDAARGTPALAEIDGYGGRLPRDAGLVLDATCGSGRLLLPLLARGIAIHGADGSAEALALAQARLDAAGLATTLYRQDLATLNLPMRFAAAIVDGEALGRRVEPAAIRAALARLRAHLVEPARLVVDAAIPAWAHARYGAPLVELREVALDDGSRIRARFEIDADPDRGAAKIRARYAQRRGSALVAEETESTRLAWFEPEVLAAMVRDAGWREVAVDDAMPEDTRGGRRFAIVASG